MKIEYQNYILEVKADGIYLYQKAAEIDKVTGSFSNLVVDQTKAKKEVGSDNIFLERVTLIGASYDLVFSIVDAIVNRSLQRGFSFEKDSYAKHLRIMFGMLVRNFNITYGFKYDKKNYSCNPTFALNVDGFMAIKRLLDSDKKTEEEKRAFLGIHEKVALDEALAKAIDAYYSDDSDIEAEKSEDEEEPNPPKPFAYSLDKHSAQKQILQDQYDINEFLRKRDPSKDKLEIKDGKVKLKDKVLKTDFIIPGFRGINHMPLRFSDDARRIYRSKAFQEARAKMPYYSESVQMSRFDFYRDKEGIKQHFLINEQGNSNRKGLDDNATQLEEVLLKLREGHCVLVIEEDVRLFSNTLLFLQHVYSNGIIKSQRLLLENLKHNEILLPMLNAFNPFVSESEAPEHALRYSAARKPLYEHAALHPHYNQKGKPSFPYIGEIFISLRDMNVFTGRKERNQLRRFEKKYRVNPDMMIGPEIESTGFARLPAGEVVFSEAVKCPNFSGHWKKIYREKYGLTKQEFTRFKTRFAKSRTKTDRTAIENEVLDHLIKYYSNRLLKRAVELAGKDRILIFLDSDGCLSLKLPKRDMKNEAHAISKKIRIAIERELIAKAGKPKLEVQLTSKKMKIYTIPFEKVEAVIKAQKISDPDMDEDYDAFLLDEERLRTPPSSTSSSRSSKSSSPQFSYTGSPDTPLGNKRYVSFISSPEKGMSLAELDVRHKELLREQERLIKELNLALVDYQILQTFFKLDIKDENYAKKKALYRVTLELCVCAEKIREQAYSELDSEPKPSESSPWYTIVNNTLFAFDEEEVEGDGWCLLSAIGITEPEKALNELIEKLNNGSLNAGVISILMRAVQNNFHAVDLGEEFLKEETDKDSQVILSVIKGFQKNINEAQDELSCSLANLNLITYLSRADVLQAYLNYIKKSRYADENIAAALLSLKGKKIISLQNYKKTGELSCNSEILSIHDPNVVFVIFHPGQNQLVAHYNILKYSPTKTLELRAKAVQDGFGFKPTTPTSPLKQEPGVLLQSSLENDSKKEDKFPPSSYKTPEKKKVPFSKKQG